jgi:hypothetical protein
MLLPSPHLQGDKEERASGRGMPSVTRPVQVAYLDSCFLAG